MVPSLPPLPQPSQSWQQLAAACDVQLTAASGGALLLSVHRTSIHHSIAALPLPVA
jgi:hypothetical protein